MKDMFYGAASFAQDLCPWGPALAAAAEEETYFIDPFFRTNCPNETDPLLDVATPGPFCFPCEETVILL